MAATYSASVVDKTTSRWKRDLQLTGPPAIQINDPVVDLLVDGSPAKSASEYASRIGFLSFLKNVIPLSGSFATNFRIRREA